MNAPDLATKVSELLAQVTTLENEIKMLTGRIANRDPVKTKAVEQENAILKKRAELLEKLVFSMTLRHTLPTTQEEANLNYEVFKQGAIEYFKQINLDIEIWKNIAS